MFEISIQKAAWVVTCLIFLSLFHFNYAFASDDLHDTDNLSNDDIGFSSGDDSILPHHFLAGDLWLHGNSPDIYIPVSQGNNVAIITQIGNKNQARIKQTGGNNNAEIEQQGNQNEADIRQIGFANSVEQTQLGDFNSVTATQFGHHNSIEQIQLGNGFHSRITQVGRYKSIRIIQGY